MLKPVDNFIAPQKIILFHIDLTGRVVEFNEAFKKAFSIHSDQKDSLEFSQLCHPDMPKAIVENIWETIQAGKPWWGIIKTTSSFPETTWLVQNIVPIYEGNRPKTYLSVAYPADAAQIEITEQQFHQLNAGQATLPKPSLQVKSPSQKRIILFSVLALTGMLGACSQLDNSAVGLFFVVIAMMGFSYLFFSAYTQARIKAKLHQGIDKLSQGRFNDIIADDSDWGQQLNLIRTRFAELSARHYEEAHTLAYYDALTDLPNRILMVEKIQQLISSPSLSTKPFSVLLMDLDHFKEVNDVFSHDLGDELIQQVANRIQSLVRHEDMVSRMGGDEYGILLQETTSKQAVLKANAILSALVKPYLLQGNTLSVSASIGIAHYPEHGRHYETLLKHADLAMYAAKENGRNCVFEFEPDMAKTARKTLNLETALHQAIEKQQLKLAFQPQIHFDIQSVVGFEALLRWQHPKWGMISPDDFIPIAEKSDLIVQLGHWVLSQTLAMLQQFKQQDMAHLRIAINVSAREFWRTEFVEDLQAQLSQFPEVDPSCLELELTERLAMGDPEKIISVLEALRALGVRLAIDDFGTGYSSLNYLRCYPIQVLKIDKSFVQDVGNNPDDDAVCLSIVSLAKALNMETIAEGVETPQQEAFLKSIHCTHAQGFYYAMPLYAEELPAWLSENYPKLNLPKANLTHI
ncbi:MAG: hypothetical protein COZ36_10440 [Piscirickettsiaceae bacterium CG_4_10_14_3_um_filter_44_349]|nr:MAG: hypothetical protein COZ36_10440 [Piscirickettsiaceae bacterium CG_4_10_14_3_um_filter_44_349]